ncbi:hypothetical protein ACFOLC_05315 [Lysobacter cavernae]|uniref:DUF5666 domain-containing protein n=1 Tax=Lysobacter cavernae TaxID=1685901 RepID=A0ABV7RLD1_9GAMM
MKKSPLFRVLPLALTLALATACSTAPADDGPREVTAVEVSVNGTVTAIDTPLRLVTIRDDGGAQLQVHADEDVRNFEQIRVGDTVSVDYLRAVAIDIQPAGSAKPGAYIKQDHDVAKLGDKPGASASETVTVLAPIQAIDTANNTVTVQGPRGNVVTLDVVEPEHRARLGQLKVGDMLRVAFTEAAAVEIRPKGR